LEFSPEQIKSLKNVASNPAAKAAAIVDADIREISAFVERVRQIAVEGCALCFGTTLSQGRLGQVLRDREIAITLFLVRRAGVAAFASLLKDYSCLDGRASSRSLAHRSSVEQPVIR
jgi:hypothetical protein